MGERPNTEPLVRNPVGPLGPGIKDVIIRSKLPDRETPGRHREDTGRHRADKYIPTRIVTTRPRHETPEQVPEQRSGVDDTTVTLEPIHLPGQRLPSHDETTQHLSQIIIPDTDEPVAHNDHGEPNPDDTVELNKEQIRRAIEEAGARTDGDENASPDVPVQAAIEAPKEPPEQTPPDRAEKQTFGQFPPDVPVVKDEHGNEHPADIVAPDPEKPQDIDEADIVAEHPAEVTPYNSGGELIHTAELVDESDEQPKTTQHQDEPSGSDREPRTGAGTHRRTSFLSGILSGLFGQDDKPQQQETHQPEIKPDTDKPPTDK